MPITQSAKKALRASKRKRVVNLRVSRTMQEAIKKIKKSVAAKDKVAATAALRDAQSVIDKATKGGVLKKNTAARKKSRLVRLIKKV